jgi:flagellar hook-basal body complex protein FliE
MTIVPLDADAPLPAGAPGLPAAPARFADALGHAFGAAGEALGRAELAESAFLAGRGGIAEMVVERARADALLSLAAAASSRAAQSLSTILGMQV